LINLENYPESREMSEEALAAVTKMVMGQCRGSLKEYPGELGGLWDRCWRDWK